MTNCKMILFLKNIVISMKCVIKDDGKSYPQTFLEEELFGK